MVIYEYEVPGGALNLKSTNYPAHGRQGDLPAVNMLPLYLINDTLFVKSYWTWNVCSDFLYDLETLLTKKELNETVS
jgi:hypothetical protein